MVYATYANTINHQFARGNHHNVQNPSNIHIPFERSHKVEVNSQNYTPILPRVGFLGTQPSAINNTTSCSKIR